MSGDPQDHSRIREMTELLRHRGPDGCGYFTNGAVSLGHRRLAVIDLSDAAAQPMANEDDTLHLVINGEIYNYIEKSVELRAKGHRFRSSSDSETLLHLYEEYGNDFLDHVNGMFSFILWDKKRNRLVAAVDRFGKKPLYYTSNGDRFAFSSELKSLLKLPWVAKDVNPLAIDRYLSLRYVPAPLSIFKSIRKFEPATVMTLTDGKPHFRQYWSVERQDTLKYDDDARERFQELMTDAVRIRMHSDVPLGLYLSGGVDSAVVGSLMAASNGASRVSYTLGADYEYDESERANEISDILGYEFNQVSMSPDDFNLAPRIAYHLDEPFGDLICFPSYLLAKKARDKLTVVLTGDGGDEILNGYLHHKAMSARWRGKAVFNIPGAGRIFSAGTRMAPSALLRSLFDYPDNFGAMEKNKLAGALSKVSDFGKFYEGITSCFSTDDKARLYTDGFSRLAADGEPLGEEVNRHMQSLRAYSGLSMLSILDLKYWIPFSVIFRLDKLNMANSVETRCPLLDYRIVQMAVNLEDAAKLNSRRDKEILRDMADKLYGPSTITNKKQAFYMPVTIRNRAEYHKWISGMLSRPDFENRGIFRMPYIKSMFEWFERGSMLATRQLTALAMLELWFTIFIDRSPEMTAID